MEFRFSHHNPDGVEVSVEQDPIEEAKKRRLQERIEGILDSSFFAILLLAYIILALVVKVPSPSGYSAWAVYWTLLILGDLPSSTMRAITRKTFSLFPIWSIAVFIYVFIGMYANMWHPYWVILLAIPVYYCIFSPIDRLLDDKRHGRI
jgi:hypothetical protein